MGSVTLDVIIIGSKIGSAILRAVAEIAPLVAELF